MLANLHGSAQAERRAQATLASFLAARGESQRARVLVGEVVKGGYMDHHVAYGLGVAYAQLSNRIEARRWLATAVNSGFPCYPWFQRDPMLKPPLHPLTLGDRRRRPGKSVAYRGLNLVPVRDRSRRVRLRSDPEFQHLMAELRNSWESA